MDAKRRRVEGAAEPNFFSEVLGDDVAILLAQFLEPLDALHLSQTCRRMATMYKQQRRQLRLWNEFSTLNLPLPETPQRSWRKPGISGYGKEGRRGHVFKFRNAPSYFEPTDFVLSNEQAELAVRIDKWIYREILWTCFVHRGTRRQAFLLLAEYISERFAFAELQINGLDKEMGGALSKCRFHVKYELIIDECQNMDEEDLLNWVGTTQPDQLMFRSSSTLNLSKKFFEDPRVRNQKAVGITIDKPNHGACDIDDEDLERMFLRKTDVDLVNIESRVTSNGLKAFIRKWRHSDDSFSISMWRLGIRYNEGDTTDALYEYLLDGDGAKEEPNELYGLPGYYGPAVRSYVHHKSDALRRLFVCLELVSFPNSNKKLLDVSLSEERHL